MPTQTDMTGADQNKWVASITYRSEAQQPLSRESLQNLVEQARARNSSVGVTGVLLCDRGRFLQTLEGPPDAVDQVWASIQRDPRHSGIDVISQHITPTRLFSSWHVQLYDKGSILPKDTQRGSNTPMLLTDHVPVIAKFALDGDERRLNERIADLVAQGWMNDALVKHLLEPTARMLGDAWLADDCTELDLTIAMSMLQLAGHAVHSRQNADCIRKSRYSILLATAPGEAHMLGASLLGDMFINAGWKVDITFPESDEALAQQLRSKKPDAVDIALSDALPRHHMLETLRETIENTRNASSNEFMVISVGGRLFAEAAATATLVGADHARKSASGTSVSLARMIEERRMQKQPTKI